MPQLLPMLINLQRLTELACYTCVFHDSTKPFMKMTATPRPAATSITKLVLRDSLRDRNVSLADRVKVCPLLKTLSVISGNTTRLGPIIQFNPGPLLSRLVLDCGRLKDTELAEVLARCTSLKDFSLWSTPISRQVFAALSRHFDSLVSLDFLILLAIEQWMVRRIFERCPRLVKVQLSYLDVKRLYDTASDDQLDLPWACHDSLMILWIPRMRMSADPSVNGRVMRQLLRLERLQSFVIGSIYRWDGTEDILEPEDVPGDTPESHLLARLCERRNRKFSINRFHEEAVKLGLRRA